MNLGRTGYGSAMAPTELAPDVRARVRSERSPEPQVPAAPARPPAGRRRQVQRFGSTPLAARHHWVLESLLVLAGLVVLLVLLVR